jgi:hypothetical protein
VLNILANSIAGRGHVSDARPFSTALGPASEFACAARVVLAGAMAVAWIFEDRDRDQRQSVVLRTHTQIFPHYRVVLNRPAVTVERHRKSTAHLTVESGYGSLNATQFSQSKPELRRPAAMRAILGV